MKYYKLIESGVITMIGSGSVVGENQIEITAEEHEALMATIKEKPEDTLETVYYLSESGEYVGRERTEAEKVDWFTMVVQNGTVALEDVPEEYRAEVKSRLPKTEAEEILEEVSGYDY